MSEDYGVRFGTAEEARGDYEHDLQRQREVDNMKKYRVIVKHEMYYEYEVEGETEVLARIAAVDRMERGDWGKEVSFGKASIFDMEVVK